MTATTEPTEPRTHSRRPATPSPTIANCDALIVSLASQRFVIVRRGDPIRIWSAEQLCRPIRTLRPGERVYYNGRADTVRAITVY
ncbi:hypothetical protein Enr13x_03240 [Stieleria neptunia]|uniref:Uncharacterized protein n=1 Tax=Stieleria neptunia TaxID=2527979 RepID=A0A518HI40_9BACT|nr:hypothetical protein [Stieleria neptunia]QDV40518.1 hypothetical protein Enr13x_03240 [Stieleria neptunia]